MSRLHGKVAQPCRACKNVYARQFRETGTGTPSPTVDPCPVCGVPQAAHWRCRRCTSRGHAMGRGRIDGALCAWCDSEINGRRRP